MFRDVAEIRRQIAQITAATVVIAALTSTPSSADTITFFSGDGGDIVNDGAAVVIAPHPAWGDVSSYAGLAPGTAGWISYADTGMGGSVPENADSRTIGDQTALFTRTFEILSTGAISVWLLADDTATVRLVGSNGYNQTLMTAYPGQIDPCAPGGTGAGLGCVQADMGFASVAGLLPGLYTLEIFAFQTNGWVFGAQYAGQVESVPEPASLMLLGTGIAALAARGRLRRQKASR